MDEPESTEESVRCSFCGKSREEVRWVIAGPAEELLDELPRVYICDECVPVCADVAHGQTVETKLLKAKTEQEVDVAFDCIFDVVNQARTTGSTSHLEDMFRWVQKPEALEHLHADLLLACLRLTFTMKQYLETWPDLLIAIEKELTRRGEDSQQFLCGLMR